MEDQVSSREEIEQRLFRMVQQGLVVASINEESETSFRLTEKGKMLAEQILFGTNYN